MIEVYNDNKGNSFEFYQDGDKWVGYGNKFSFERNSYDEGVEQLTKWGYYKVGVE